MNLLNVMPCRPAISIFSWVTETEWDVSVSVRSKGDLKPGLTRQGMNSSALRQTGYSSLDPLLHALIDLSSLESLGGYRITNDEINDPREFLESTPSPENPRIVSDRHDGIARLLGEHGPAQIVF